jgi:hypothetical protein
MNTSLFLSFVACNSTEINTMDSADLETTPSTEDSSTFIEQDCPITATPSVITFPSVPAMSLIQEIEVTLSHDCLEPHVLLQSPSDWTDDPHFHVTLPSSALIDTNTKLNILFEPTWNQFHQTTLHIPYTHPDAPLEITLEAEVTEPLPLLIVGGQLRRILSNDYGNSITMETQDTGIQRQVCWGNDSYLIVGGMEQGTIWRSQTAQNWQQYILDTASIYTCAYGNGRFIMYADGLFSSIAGVDWEEGSDTPWIEETIRDIEFGGGVFVAVGDQGRIGTTTHGVEWTRDALQGNFQLNSVSFGNELFVAVGNFGAILWSDDLGESWTTERVGNGTFQRVVFGNGYFFTSDGSDLYRSEDGVIWNAISTEGIKPLSSYGIILIGIKGQILYHSFDQGLSWLEQATLTQTAPIFDAIIAGP